MTAFLFLFLGILVGYTLRTVLKIVQPSAAHCNLHTSGITWRWWAGLVMIIVGFILGMKFLIFIGGFVWYESRSKWCAVQSLRKIGH